MSQPRKMVSLKADIPPSKAVAAQETVGAPNKLGVYVHGGKSLPLVESEEKRLR